MNLDRRFFLRITSAVVAAPFYALELAMPDMAGVEAESLPEPYFIFDEPGVNQLEIGDAFRWGDDAPLGLMCEIDADTECWTKGPFSQEEIEALWPSSELEVLV